VATRGNDDKEILLWQPIVKEKIGKCYLRIKTGLFLRDLRFKTGRYRSRHGKVRKVHFHRGERDDGAGS
jgi:hypothetical protein